jgi:hypothetical protein
VRHPHPREGLRKGHSECTTASSIRPRSESVTKSCERMTCCVTPQQDDAPTDWSNVKTPVQKPA